MAAWMEGTIPKVQSHTCSEAVMFIVKKTIRRWTNVWVLSSGAEVNV